MVQEILTEARTEDLPVHCECNGTPIPMVCRKVHGRFFVARWPGSGDLHADDCPSFDGNVTHEAVSSLPDGTIDIRLSFSLAPPQSKSQGSAPRHAKSSDIHIPRRAALDMGGLLRQLWRLSDLDKWHPNMAGHRNWGMVGHYLRLASLPVVSGNLPLPEFLFIPNRHQKNDPIPGAQHAAELAEFAAKHGRALVIAPIFGIESARYGYRLRFSHMFWAQVFTKAGQAIHAQLAALPEGNRLIGIALIEPRGNHFNAQEVATITVNQQWLPYASAESGRVIEHLVEKGVSFLLNDQSGGDLGKVLRHGKPVARIVVSPNTSAAWIEQPLEGM